MLDKKMISASKQQGARCDLLEMVEEKIGQRILWLSIKFWESRLEEKAKPNPTKRKEKKKIVSSEKAQLKNFDIFFKCSVSSLTFENFFEFLLKHDK